MAISAYGLMEFPEKLEKTIARSGKSQSALARETGVAQSAISAMTRGERRPFMDQAFRIARALGVPLDYLADDTIDEPPIAELSGEERLLLRICRRIGIDEVIDYLTPPGSAPWIPGSVRDQTSLAERKPTKVVGVEVVQDRREELQPKKRKGS